eukprot:4716845-Prymnesium_polylepis.1
MDGHGHTCGPAPLIARLQHAHDNQLPVHAQRYATLPQHGRRIDADPALTPLNTRPIRLHVDFSSLFEEHGPQYSHCWRQGAWYRRGNPKAKEPPAAQGASGAFYDTSAVCQDTEHHADDDCWGVCMAHDVITPAARSMMMKVVSSIVRNE